MNFSIRVEVLPKHNPRNVTNRQRHKGVIPEGDALIDKVPRQKDRQGQANEIQHCREGRIQLASFEVIKNSLLDTFAQVIIAKA
jgi:hypothetical protein